MVHLYAMCATKDKLFPFLYIPGHDPLSTYGYPTFAHTHTQPAANLHTTMPLHNLWTILPTWTVESLLSIIYSYRSNDITWQVNLLMRLVSFISNCCLMCIKSLSVCINISPSLLEELPDCNEVTWIKALWYENFCYLKLPISKVVISWKPR